MEISDQHNNWSGDAAARCLRAQITTSSGFHHRSSNNLSSKTQNLISLVVKDNEFA